MIETVLSSGTNEFDPITENPHPRWNGGEEIVHMRLKVPPREAGDKMDFVGELVPNTPAPHAIDDYIRLISKSSPLVAELLGKDVIEKRLSGHPSPFDVPIHRPSILIFELDDSVPNWRFVAPGMTSKERQTGYEFGLRYVIDGEGVMKAGDIPPDINCRILVLKVAYRSKARKSHFFNLHTEFFDLSGKRLSVIFDPDIPNGGGDDIPPVLPA